MSEKSRILTFDLLRGYFLFVIIIDHLLRSFNIWELFTGRGAQWISAAEGFFFVSGIMIGMVRGRSMIGQPITEVFKRCWRRAGTLYLWSVGLTALYCLIAVYLTGHPGLKPGYFDGSINNFLLKTLSLQFSYGWADFLVFYTVYLFFAPFAIWALRNKLWQLVLALSLLVWAQTYSEMGGWQIIFFIGVICGFYKDEIENFFLGLGVKTRRILAFLIYLATAVTLSLSVFFTTLAEEYGKPGSSGKLLGFNVADARDYSIEVLRPHFDKISMQPARLILFFIWFCALYMLVKRFEASIAKYLGWFFLTLGQNSLYVYIISSVPLFFNFILIGSGQPWYTNTLLGTAVLAAVWLATKKRFLFGFIPR